MKNRLNLNSSSVNSESLIEDKIDYLDDEDSIKISKNEKDIGENAIFTSKKINEVSEKDSSENKECQSDNANNSIIPVPGLSVRNDYNLEKSDNN